MSVLNLRFEDIYALEIKKWGNSGIESEVSLQGLPRHRVCLFYIPIAWDGAWYTVTIQEIMLSGLNNDLNNLF